LELYLKDAKTNKDLENIKKLYLDSFPKSERKPFSLMLEKQKQGFFDILAIETEDKKFSGLAITIKYADLLLLDYFAISPEFRGTGIGSAVLALLRNKYRDRKFILEIERLNPDHPEYQTRLRRKNFYLRNGMKSAEFFVDLFGEEMEVMTFDDGITFSSYHEIFKKVFSEQVSKKVKLIDTSGKL